MTQNPEFAPECPQESAASRRTAPVLKAPAVTISPRSVPDSRGSRARGPAVAGSDETHYGVV